MVGFGDVVALSNGNYVVSSPYWHNGGATNAGAVTWGNGTMGITGTVSSANSLVGSTGDDYVGMNVAALSNGYYVVRSPDWDDGAVADAGAVTMGWGTIGARGPITDANSVRGTTANGGYSMVFAYDYTNSQLVVGRPADNIVTLFGNDAPVADAGSNQAVNTLALVTLDGSASSDPDGHLPLTYGWTQTGGPSVSFSPTLSVTTFTAPGNPAALTFTLTVTDSLGLASAPDEVVVTVNNQAPVASAGSDQSVNRNTLVTLDGSGSSDLDDDLPLTYHWTQTGGSSVTFNDALSITTFTAPGDPTVLTFTLTVTDSLGLASTPDEVVITVTNQAPAADAGGDQSVDTNTLVTLDGSSSSDPDGDVPLTYLWTQTGGPAVSFTPGLSVTTFIALNDPGVFTFTLTVTDSLGLASAPAEVVVTVDNQPPVAGAGGDQSVDTLALVTLDGSASSDPDGDVPLTYLWTQTGGHSATLSDPAAAQPTFSAPDDPGVLTFTLTVTDSLGLPDPTPDEVVVTVNNQPPVADAGGDQSVDANAIVSLDGSGSSDPDGDLPLTYLWMQTGGPAVALNNPAGVGPAFIAPSASTVLTFTLIATDSLGLVDPTPDEIVVTVIADNQPPIADAGSNQSVNTNAIVTLDGSGSSDPDGHLPLTYFWAQTGGLPVTLNNPATAVPTFTAPSDLAVLTFTLTITDSLGLVDSTPDEVVITVEGYRIYLPLVVRQDASSAAEVWHTYQQAPAMQIGFASKVGWSRLLPSVGPPLLPGLALWRKRQSKEFA
jgi:hypothetical protein